MNGEAAGQPRGEAETGRRMTTARGRMTAETKRKRRGQEYWVSGNGYRGERRKRGGLGESDNASEGWSSGSKVDSAESETEENRMPAGEPEESGNMLMLSPWGMQ